MPKGKGYPKKKKSKSKGKKISTKNSASPKTMVMSAEDKKWRAESDMDTLVRAEEIKGDKSRLSKAKSVARKRAKDLSKVVKK